MSRDADTYRAAARLIDQFGLNASDHAAQWLAESMLDGDNGSYRFWRDVMETVNELLNDDKPETGLLH